MEDTMIIVGEDASRMELESARAISTNLKEFAGSEPVIRSDTDASDQDRTDRNLILIGSPDSNHVLIEAYEIGYGTRVTTEYPGENKGILEISANPWNEKKSLLIIAGSDEWGVIACTERLIDHEEVAGFDSAIVMTEWTKGQETNGSGVNVTGDALLGKYETGDREFNRYEIGSKIVYFHQRMIGDAIVEGDYIRYQFDKDTEELLDKEVHWRDDLPEHLPAVISKEEAESMVNGTIQSSRLYFISPESDVFPLEPTPQNPCWVVKSIADDNMTVTIIDAVNGELLGYGVPPPASGDYRQ